jgi:two-component system chemotaxis response regulator CheY
MKSVLIVDDSEFIRNTLYRIMNEKGFHVVGMGANGLEALDRYKALKPDIITLDISMPIMDGLKALKRIREMDQKVVIIVISSLSAEENLTEIHKAGANYFVAKPFEEKEILGVLGRFAD